MPQKSLLKKKNMKEFSDLVQQLETIDDEMTDLMSKCGKLRRKREEIEKKMNRIKREALPLHLIGKYVRVTSQNEETAYLHLRDILIDDDGCAYDTTAMYKGDGITYKSAICNDITIMQYEIGGLTVEEITREEFTERLNEIIQKIID